MNICAGLVGLKSGKVLPAAARSTFFRSQKGPGAPQDDLQLSEPKRFWVILALVCGYFGVITSRLLWGHVVGSFGVHFVVTLTSR